MKSFHAQRFAPRQLALLKLAARIVESIPQDRPIETFRCHEVARIVGQLLELPVQDGRYGVVDHSWCWTEPLSIPWKAMYRLSQEQAGVAILDPYAVGSMPPVRLLGIDRFLPHLYGAYVPTEPRTDIDEVLVTSVIRHLSPFVEMWKASEKEI